MSLCPQYNLFLLRNFIYIVIAFTRIIAICFTGTKIRDDYTGNHRNVSWATKRVQNYDREEGLRGEISARFDRSSNGQSHENDENNVSKS